jgi:hypothetical protein
VARLYQVLGSGPRPDPRPNQVGSLYRKVARVLDVLSRREPHRLDYGRWQARLKNLTEEGESEHFELFRSRFEGTHPALPGPEVWSEYHPDNPAISLRYESGLPRCGQPVPDERLPALRHLANLHYWSVCTLLDLSYRHGGQFHSAARRHMTGPLRSLGGELARNGHGLPFDVFVPGYAPGLGDRQNLAVAHGMLREVATVQERFARFLPFDYPQACVPETLWELTTLTWD